MRKPIPIISERIIQAGAGVELPVPPCNCPGFALADMCSIVLIINCPACARDKCFNYIESGAAFDTAWPIFDRLRSLGHRAGQWDKSGICDPRSRQPGFGIAFGPAISLRDNLNPNPNPSQRVIQAACLSGAEWVSPGDQYLLYLYLFIADSVLILPLIRMTNLSWHFPLYANQPKKVANYGLRREFF